MARMACRLPTALLLLFGCCGLSALVEVGSDATADHLSLLQRRAVALLPEPATALAYFADEDLRLSHVEPHPRRAWRRRQGLPVAQRRSGHPSRRSARHSGDLRLSRVERASLYGAAEVSSRHSGEHTAQGERGVWAANAARVAQLAKSEEATEIAEIAMNATTEAAQAARLAELAEIQSLFEDGVQASKAAKDHVSQVWRWEDNDQEMTAARESDRQEVLAAESAFEAEVEAEKVYAEESKANSSGNSSGLVQQTILPEVRDYATVSSQSNSTTSSVPKSDVVGIVQSAGVQPDDSLETGPAPTASEVASLVERDQGAVWLDTGDAGNSTVADDVVFDANAQGIPADAAQAQVPNIPSSTDETATSNMESLLGEDLGKHLASNITFARNVSTIALSGGDVEEGSAGVTMTAISPLREDNASGEYKYMDVRTANASEVSRLPHIGNATSPVKAKFVFEIDGKNVSAVQALRAKAQHASTLASQESKTTEIVAIAPGAYYVVNAKRQKYLSTLGTNVSVFKTDNFTNDGHARGLQWRFDPVHGKNDTFHVVNVRYQEYLNTLGGPAQLWASPHQRDAARGGPPSLEWRLQPAGQADTYYFVNGGEQKYMDVRNGTVSVWRGHGLEDLGAEPGNIQWRLERVETQEAKECEAYVGAKDPGCLWTGNWSCPSQAVGVKGVAGSKGGQETIGFRCCCGLGLWAAPYAVDTPGTDARLS